jgi:hypothetical protein
MNQKNVTQKESRYHQQDETRNGNLPDQLCRNTFNEEHR